MMKTVQKRCNKILQSQLPVVCGFQSQLAYLHQTGVQIRNDFGPSVMDDVDEFTHNVAIKISRVMNSLNPNDLLARRLIDIAKTNSCGRIYQGGSGLWPYTGRISQGITHGDTRPSKARKLGHHVAPVQGLTVHDTDVLEPEPARKGGLVRPDTVRILPHILPDVRAYSASATLSVFQLSLFRHQPHGDPSSASISSLKRKDQQQKPLSLITETEKDSAQTARSLISRVRSIKYSYLIYVLTNSFSS